MARRGEAVRVRRRNDLELRVPRLLHCAGGAARRGGSQGTGCGVRHRVLWQEAGARRPQLIRSFARDAPSGHLLTIVQIPMAMNPTPATTFSVRGETNRST